MQHHTSNTCELFDIGYSVSYAPLVTPPYFLPVFALQAPLFISPIFLYFLVRQSITSPNPLNPQFKRPLNPINQSYANGPDLLPMEILAQLLAKFSATPSSLLLSSLRSPIIR